MNRGVPAAIRFAAVIVTGMALIAPAAHLLELANKIGMETNDYFVVQRVYAGWWLVGLLLPAALLANLALVVAARADRSASRLALVAAALIALNLVIFFVWTQPANTATVNWTIQPENWRSLRREWEYSHAVNAGIMFIAFCETTAESVRAKL